MTVARTVRQGEGKPPIGTIAAEKRGGLNRNPGPKRSKIKCRNCPKMIPLLAVKHNDPFCSMECCRDYYEPREKKAEREAKRSYHQCSGCGRDTKDLEYTPRCKPCSKRRYYRL